MLCCHLARASSPDSTAGFSGGGKAGTAQEAATKLIVVQSREPVSEPVEPHQAALSGEGPPAAAPQPPPAPGPAAPGAAPWQRVPLPGPAPPPSAPAGLVPYIAASHRSLVAAPAPLPVLVASASEAASVEGGVPGPPLPPGSAAAARPYPHPTPKPPQNPAIAAFQRSEVGDAGPEGEWEWLEGHDPLLDVDAPRPPSAHQFRESATGRGRPKRAAPAPSPDPPTPRSAAMPPAAAPASSPRGAAAAGTPAGPLDPPSPLARPAAAPVEEMYPPHLFTSQEWGIWGGRSSSREVREVRDEIASVREVRVLGDYKDELEVEWDVHTKMKLWRDVRDRAGNLDTSTDEG